MKTMRSLLILGLLVAGAGHLPGSDGGVFELRGEAVPASRLGQGPLAGGRFVAYGGVVAPTSPQGGGYVLAPVASCATNQVLQATSGCGCLCSGIFTDGFESGDTTAWSSQSP